MDWAELLGSSTLEKLLKWWATLQATFVIALTPEFRSCGTWTTFQWFWSIDIPFHPTAYFNQVESKIIKVVKGQPAPLEALPESIRHKWVPIVNSLDHMHWQAIWWRASHKQQKVRNGQWQNPPAIGQVYANHAFRNLLLRTVEAHISKQEILNARAQDHIPSWSAVLKSSTYLGMAYQHVSTYINHREVPGQLDNWPGKQRHKDSARNTKPLTAVKWKYVEAYFKKTMCWNSLWCVILCVDWSVVSRLLKVLDSFNYPSRWD